jgi:hypothetical protein
MMIPMTLLAMLISIICLIEPEFSAKRFAFAVIFAIIATYSFGTGIVIWAVGAAILLAKALQKNNKVAYIHLGAWGVACIIAMAVYFIGYESTPSQTTAAQALLHPIAFLTYLAAYIGAPLAPFHGPSAVIVGVVGLAWMARFLTKMREQSEQIEVRLRMALSLVLLPVGCALLTGLKQWPEGPDQAISSRYLMWPSMLWVGLLILNTTGMGSRRIKNTTVAIITIFGLFATLHGAYRADERHDAFELGKEALRTNSERNFQYLYPTLDVPQKCAKTWSSTNCPSFETRPMPIPKPNKSVVCIRELC